MPRSNAGSFVSAGHQLIVIMFVRTSVRRGTIWVAGVIHAGPEVFIIEVRVLVVQPKRMANLLASHQSATRESYCEPEAK